MAFSDPLLIDPQLLQQAEEFCTKRLEREPENRAVLRSLAEIHRKQGKLGEAETAYARLCRLDPQDLEAGYLRAVLGGDEVATVPAGIHAAPFVLLEDFLPRDLHDGLVPLFTSVQDGFVPVKQDREYRPDIRQTLEFPHEWEGKARFTTYLEETLPRILPRLYLPQFQIARYAVQVRAYQDGHFFKIHRDVDPNFPGANRMINFVYYFHKQPKPYTGGELLLFDSDTDLSTKTMTMSRFTRVVPEDNSIIFFPPHFYHSVVPIRCPSRDFSDSRFVINGHVHKKAGATPALHESVHHVGAAS